VLLAEFIKPIPEHVLLDISVNDPEEGGICFGATIKELITEERFKKYLNFDVTYACPEITLLSFACTQRAQKTCILIDLENIEGEE
jgi:hypothetical protein